MLQQTQVSRVLTLYPRFLNRFPTLRSLARARQRSVVLAWRGLGYNNRAVRLHRLARTLTRHHGARIPSHREILLSLPGVGRYTAHAILTFAFRKPVPVVDVNIRRVLSRLFWSMPSITDLRPENDIWETASAILPRRRTHLWNQALMDLGATVCTARRPLCATCPFGGVCRSRTHMRRSAPPHERVEPSFAGIPRRIYRGRVIEELRSAPHNQPLAARVLRRRVAGKGKPVTEKWFSRLLRGLEKDGLIHLERTGRITRVRLT